MIRRRTPEQIAAQLLRQAQRQAQPAGAKVLGPTRRVFDPITGAAVRLQYRQQPADFIANPSSKAFRPTTTGRELDDRRELRVASA